MAPWCTVHAIPRPIFCLVLPRFFITNLACRHIYDIAASSFFPAVFLFIYCCRNTAAFYDCCHAIAASKFQALLFTWHPKVKYIPVSYFFNCTAPVCHCINPAIHCSASAAYFYFRAEWYFWRCSTCVFIGVCAICRLHGIVVCCILCF